MVNLYRDSKDLPKILANISGVPIEVIPPELCNADFVANFHTWLNFCKDVYSEEPTPVQCEAWLNLLSFSHAPAECLKRSIRNRWKGIFITGTEKEGTPPEKIAFHTSRQKRAKKKYQFTIHKRG